MRIHGGEKKKQIEIGPVRQKRDMEKKHRKNVFLGLNRVKKIVEYLKKLIVLCIQCFTLF